MGAALPGPPFLQARSREHGVCGAQDPAGGAAGAD